MNQKTLIILFLVLILLGLGGAGAAFIKEDSVVRISPSPSPTPGLSILNQNQSAISGSQPDTPLVFNSNITNNTSPTKPPGNSRLVKQYRQFPGVLSPEELKDKTAVIETAKGNIEFEIYPEATKAASNFIFLAKDGFYNNLTFHRVEPNFVIQGGDPIGNGTGGPGYRFEDEPVTRQYLKGTVAMANSGPNTNGSQFFIMLADHPELPPNYTIFGQVIKGQDVVEKIRAGDIMRKVSLISLPGINP